MTPELICRELRQMAGSAAYATSERAIMRRDILYAAADAIERYTSPPESPGGHTSRTTGDAMTTATETKHTPGPWHWSPDSWNGGYCGLFAEDGSDVVVPQHRNDGDDGAAWFEEISDADRLLIAAAPQLLDACKQLIAMFDGEDECTEILDYIGRPDSPLRAAIDAATK